MHNLCNYSCCNYHVNCLILGEDETSYGRHKKALQIEFKKANLNTQIVDELMQLSFAMHWKDINEISTS